MQHAAPGNGPAWQSHRMSSVLRIACVVVMAWLGWAALLYASQRGLVFPGAQLRAPPGTDPTGAERITVHPDGGRLDAFLLRAAGQARAPAILFAHGNAEFAVQNIRAFAPWRDAGLHVLLVEYPGYDGAPGAPSQASIDARWLAAFDWLAAQPFVDPARIVGFGRSLGSGPTAALAARRPLAAVVLQSAYADTRWFAHDRLLPGFLVRDRWDNLSALRAYGGPVFAAHGRHDRVVPPRHAEALATLPNVRMAWFDCGHNDCPWFDAAYRAQVLGFLAFEGVIVPPARTPAPSLSRR